MEIHSGYKTITPAQLANALWALDAKLIRHRDFRLYLACFVLVAIREAAARTNRIRGSAPRELPRYRLNEMERITKLPSRHIKSGLRRLANCGLVTFSEGDIAMTKELLPGAEELAEKLSCQRSPKRPIPVPRAVLRFLAASSSEALTRVMIAYLVRGLSIARRTGEISAKGTVKASWIADTLSVSKRAVKYAQAELRRLGWIGKDTNSVQRKLNRDGAYFAINLSWTGQPAEGGDARGTATAALARHSLQSEVGQSIVTSGKDGFKIAPPALQNCMSFAPPREDKETSYEVKYQKAQAPEPADVCFKERQETVPVKQGEHAPPSWRNVCTEDLCRLDRLEVLFIEATQRGWLNASEASALNFVAAAVRAREVGEHPPKLFVFLVRHGLWSHISQAQEDRARKALARCREQHPNCFRLEATGAYFEAARVEGNSW